MAPPFPSPPHQPVPANHEFLLRQPPFPPRAGADRGRLDEQAVFFLLPGQPGELCCQRVPGREKGFLAVEDGGIGALGVVVAVEPPRPERELGLFMLSKPRHRALAMAAFER